MIAWLILILLLAPKATALPTERVPEPTCKNKILMAPALVRDTLLSQALTERATALITAHYGLKCPHSPYVSSEKSRILLDYFGITSFFSRSPVDLSESQIEDIRSESGASYLAFTSWDPKSRRIRIDLWYMNKENRVKTAGRLMDRLTHSESSELPRAHPFINFLTLLTPNTVTLGFVSTEVNGFQAKDEGEDFYAQKTRTRSQVPAIVSSIGFNKIEHPSSYYLFDWSGSLFPSTYLYGIDQLTTFARKSQKDKESKELEYGSIKIYGSCTNLNAMGSIHSPLGTTYAALGYGPCIHWRKVDNDQPVWQLDLAARILFGHRIFVSRDWYLFFEGDQLTFRKNIYNTHVAKSDSIGRGTLGFGWYFADVDSQYTNFVTSLFDSE